MLVKYAMKMVLLHASVAGGRGVGLGFVPQALAEKLWLCCLCFIIKTSPRHWLLLDAKGTLHSLPR